MATSPEDRGAAMIVTRGLRRSAGTCGTSPPILGKSKRDVGAFAASSGAERDPIPGWTAGICFSDRCHVPRGFPADSGPPGRDSVFRTQRFPYHAALTGRIRTPAEHRHCRLLYPPRAKAHAGLLFLAVPGYGGACRKSHLGKCGGG